MTQYNLSPIFSVHNKAVVLEQNEDKVRIGLVNFDDYDLRKKIEKSFFAFNAENNNNCNLDFVQITDETCSKITSILLSDATPYQKETSLSIPLKEAESSYDVLESPAVNFLNAVILESLEKGVSDIHFETKDEQFSTVRIRLDGKMLFYKTLENALFQAVCRRIKLLANLEITDSHKIQDGKFSYKKGAFCADIRVSAVPSWNGESVVLRLLRKNEEPPKLCELGFTDEQISTIQSLINKNNSLVVICGSTGDGKTTTLAAMLSEIQKTNQKIITIENPVEYKLKGITQIEVNSENDLDFSKVLSSCFRQDPDVIMIGEIRDEKTAEIAVRAALTGHLVLATLHGADCCSSINRLLDLKVRPFLLASVLSATIAQHLVQKPSGGRTAVAEILKTSPEVKQMILNESPSFKFAEYMQQHNLPRIADLQNAVATNTADECIATANVVATNIADLQGGRCGM